jgi:hypothetical protein
MLRALHRIEGREGALGPPNRKEADVVARASSSHVLFGPAVCRQRPPSLQKVRREARAVLVGPRGRDGLESARDVSIRRRARPSLKNPAAESGPGRSGRLQGPTGGCQRARSVDKRGRTRRTRRAEIAHFDELYRRTRRPKTSLLLQDCRARQGRSNAPLAAQIRPCVGGYARSSLLAVLYQDLYKAFFVMGMNLF